MKQLILMCGPPGAGKSTLLKEAIDTDIAKVVSRDQIRFDLLKDGDDYFAYEDEVWEKFIEEIQEGIENEKYYSVYADATHLSPKARKKVIQALNIPKGVELGAINFNVPVETCLERNARRSGRALVPEDAVRNMCRSFKPATAKEGFAYIWNTDDSGYIM